MKKPKQTELLHLVAVDVTALYHIMSRNLARQALKKALQVVNLLIVKTLQRL